MSQPTPYSLKADLRTHWPLFAGLCLALCIWCAVDVQKRGVIDPENPRRHMTDFTVYTEAGVAFFDGREPYEVANIRGWKYLYPPLFALLVAPLQSLSGEAQVTVWYFISLLLCGGCYYETRRLLALVLAELPERTRDVTAPRIQTLFVWAGVAALLPTLNCLQRGQIGIALLYPLLLGIRLIVANRGARAWLAGGIVLALPVAFKLTPALPVACLLGMLFLAQFYRSRQAAWAHLSWSTAGVLVGGALFLLLIPASLLGWNANLQHLETWHAKVASKVSDVRSDDFGGDVSSVRNQSLCNAAYRGGNWLCYQLGVGPDDRLVDSNEAEDEVVAMPMEAGWLNRWLEAIRMTTVLILGLACWRLARTGSTTALLCGFGLACAATLVVSPVSRGHYFLLMLPASAFASAWQMMCGRPKSAFATVVIPAVLCSLHYCVLDIVGRMGLLGLGTTLWLFATFAAVSRSALSYSTIAAEPIATSENGSHAVPEAVASSLPMTGKSSSQRRAA